MIFKLVKSNERKKKKRKKTIVATTLNRIRIVIKIKVFVVVGKLMVTNNAKKGTYTYLYL